MRSRRRRGKGCVKDITTITWWPYLLDQIVTLMSVVSYDFKKKQRSFFIP